MSSSSGLILVTGAGGFIALHIIDKFIKQGYKVRGTVRNLNDKGKIASLRQIAPEDKLELVQVDLLDDDSKWQSVMKGVTICMHVASPFPSSQPKDENELIRPAVEGTLKVFRAAFAEKVKRVVLTSSTVAIIGYKQEPREYKDTDWADLESSMAYGKSKTLAEKAAWDFVDEKRKSNEKIFELVVMNPSFVLGPTLHGQSVTLGTSEERLLEILSGKTEKISNFWVPVCDVRDVAEAHFKGAFSASAVGHRHPLLTLPEKVSWQTVAGIVNDEFAPKGYKISTVASDVTPPVSIKVDNSRMLNDLGIKPRPLKQTIIDMANSLINAGLVK